MTLKEYMAREGIRGGEMARRLDVAQSTVSRYIRQRRRPSWAILARLRDATGGAVTAEDFLDSDPALDRPCDTEGEAA